MTLAELLGAWAERDRRYSFHRPIPLNEANVAALRVYREAEIDELPLPAQAKARRELAMWTLPRRVW